MSNGWNKEKAGIEITLIPANFIYFYWGKSRAKRVNLG
jgi:hypothetical protein